MRFTDLRWIRSLTEQRTNEVDKERKPEWSHSRPQVTGELTYAEKSRMIQFIEFLEEIEHNKGTVVISGEQVARLVAELGDQVRTIGVWNHATNGSIEIPMSNIIEAVQSLDSGSFSEAVRQLKSPPGFLKRSSAAEHLIAALSKLRFQQFECKVQRYQECADPLEAERLRSEISSELFGG